MIKRTCNARDLSRMKKMASRGRSVTQMGQALNISVGCIRRNMQGIRVAKDMEELDYETEIIGGGDGAAPEAKPFTAANPGTGHLAKTPTPEVGATAAPAGIAIPAAVPAATPTVPAVTEPALTPQQKAANTRRARAQATVDAAKAPAAGAAGDDAAGDPEFLE